MSQGQLDPEEAANNQHERPDGDGPRKGAQSSEETGALSPESARQLLYELRVHQVELQMQNEELRRAQQELEASRARYVDLYDLAPVGYVTLCEEGRVLEANLTAAGLLGAARRELLQQKLTRFILPEDQDVYFRHRRQLFETGTPQVCELRLLRRDGHTFWARLQASPPHEDGGQPVCRTVLSDVTERKRTEETLRASEARHRMLFERSRDALMTLTSPDWRVTSVNSSTISMFGVADEADFVSRPPWHYSPERQPDGRASAEKARAMVETALREGSHFFEWAFHRPSGDPFLATVLLTRMEIDGQPLLQVTVRDETHLKRLQAVLGQADRLASMGMLAAGVAHEINNPLVYVLYNVGTLAADLPRITGAARRCFAGLRNQVGDAAFLEIAGEDAPMLDPSMLEDTVDRAREALAGAQRIKNISRALGTFSRVESVERSMVDVNYAIECAVTMAFNEIKYRARLVKDLGPVPAIRASEGKLSQVFLNLLINASHAIEEGNVENNRIIIHTWAEDGAVFAAVKDTGKGILPQNLARVFEPFFTTKTAGVGSGLGLAICKNIVTDFGGDIRVESEVGKGTRFVVRLPAPADALESLAAPGGSETARGAAASGRLLVVDDEDLILKTMKRLLGREHQVVTAASGEKGRAILEHDQAFDVILCDLMMPEMTGMDLHEWLARRNPALAARMVFITGGAFTPRASHYLASVRNLKLEKPLDPVKLKGLVSELVGAARAKRAPAPG
jgi:two-component system, cell cycle sensor histidine kinase and response regulator CckA